MLTDKTIVIRTSVDDEGRAKIRVCVDGDRLITGYVGGEPEDNMYYRDYGWIDGALRTLAEALGATVVFDRVEEEW